MILILMGVSGAGKTTMGQALADRLGWPFYDGDAFHPPANVGKMSRGIPLTDADRAAWLDRLRALIERHLGRNESTVIACSALKQAYRHRLRQGDTRVCFVYLKGSYALIKARLEARQDHFAKPDLLRSQFQALEEPQQALVVDVTQEPEAIVAFIKDKVQGKICSKSGSA